MGKSVSADLLQRFIQRNRDLLDDPRCAIGTWYNEDDGLTYLDITATLRDRREALDLALRYNQIAIFDLNHLEVPDTEGTGEPPQDVPPARERLPSITRGET
jgi:hypothetical protein